VPVARDYRHDHRLQPAANLRGRTDAQRIALREGEDFTNSMLELIGIDYYDDLLNDWCL
jgi:hypothetical protein